MPNGLSTIRRGVGFGGLSTISRGILGDFIAAFDNRVICAPRLLAADGSPLLFVLDNGPGIAAIAGESISFFVGVEPVTSAFDVEPDLLAEDCC